MSDDFYRRLSLSFGCLALLAIFSLLVFVANLEIKDLDLWLHLGMGRHIVNNGFQVPDVDMLSCTVAGSPWVNHEWLFQVIVYTIHKFAGFDGLITMQVILVAVTMLVLLLLGYSKDKQLGVVFILLLVSLVYQGRFTTRPDLFSLLFFALYIFILSFYIDRKGSVPAIFIIQLLWTNMHGFFFFGPLFVLIGLGAEWVKRHVKLPYEWNKVGRLTDAEYKRMKVIFGVVVLACIFNPMTFKGAWYPIGVFFQISGESKIFFDKIVELRNPITRATLFSAAHYPFYKLLIVLSFLSCFYNRRKLDIGGVMFWLVFLFFSLAAVRNLIFFAFAAYLIFVTNILTVSLRDVFPLRMTDKKFGYIASTFAKVIVIIWVVQYGAKVSLNGYFDFDKYERKSEFGGVSLRTYPYKAVDFLVENKVKGNFFNDFNSGAYLVGRCSPDIKVFIDGRTEVYGPEFFKYYSSLGEDDDAALFEEMLDKYQMTGVLVNTVQHPAPKNILKLLYAKEEWKVVYFDFDAVIFLKDVPKNKSVIDKHEIDLVNWAPPSFDLLKLGSQKVTPYRNVNRAYSLMALDLDDAVLAEVEEVLKIAPNYREPYKLRGKIYGKRKEYRKAFENFRIASTFAPNDKQIKLNLALAYYDMEEYGYAVKQYRKFINRWPGDPRGYFLISRALVKDQKYDKAVLALKKARSLDNKNVKDTLEIGDLLSDVQQHALAKDVYHLALQSKKDGDKVYLKLGQIHRKMGEEQKAVEAFKKGLDINPENEEIKKETGPSEAEDETQPAQGQL
ncbi:MAG: tetratricopeptide repeat protein [Candidatus Omnitrophica bacterium]|nr:tetratricopeptide repeat protein [Candidatus Omnitrophota bacterium]